MERSTEIALRPATHEGRNLPVRVSTPAISQERTGDGRYLKALAGSLLLYADETPHFAPRLNVLMNAFIGSWRIPEKPIVAPSQLQLAGKSPAGLPAATIMLMPQSDTDATRRAQWLLRQIGSRAWKHDQEAETAMTLLRSWQQQYQGSTGPESQPKLVVGVIRVAIPGVTLGRVRRVHQQMPIIVERSAMNALNTRSMAQAAGEAALATFFHELAGAGGVTRRLEPDVADWFFGERALGFYQTEVGSLNAFASELERLGVPHATAWHEGTLALVAASPTVTGMHHLSRWGIESMS